MKFGLGQLVVGLALSSFFGCAVVQGEIDGAKNFATDTAYFFRQIPLSLQVSLGKCVQTQVFTAPLLITSFGV